MTSDLTGQRFGMLLVLRRHAEPMKRRGVHWFVRCDCGVERAVHGAELRAGQAHSCGCLRRAFLASGARRSHGLSDTPLHKVWMAMRRRCSVPTDHAYASYGGRGIRVCDRWQVFENFLSDMGERPAGTSLDRIDNDGNYEPGNCRWATPIVQNRNRRCVRQIDVDGVARVSSEYAADLGLKPRSVVARIQQGWDPVVAATCPRVVPGRTRP